MRVIKKLEKVIARIVQSSLNCHLIPFLSTFPPLVFSFLVSISSRLYLLLISFSFHSSHFLSSPSIIIIISMTKKRKKFNNILKEVESQLGFLFLPRKLLDENEEKGIEREDEEKGIERENEEKGIEKMKKKE